MVSECWVGWDGRNEESEEEEAIPIIQVKVNGRVSAGWSPWNWKGRILCSQTEFVQLNVENE